MISSGQFVQLHEATPREVERELERASEDALDQIDSGIEQMGLESSRLSREINRLLVLLPRDSNRLLSSLREIGGNIRQSVLDFGNRFRNILSREQVDGVEVGAELVDRPVIQAGIELSLPMAQLPVLDDLVQFGSSLITGLEGDIVRRVNTEISLAALGDKSLDDAIERVSAFLPDDGKGKGAAHRARAIVETEVGRVHSMVGQLRMEALEDSIPDLAKMWRHSGNIRHPRTGHQAISGTVVGVRERFMVAPTVGGSREALLFPRDPVASARNSVLCRCQALPFLRRWED